MKLNLRTLVIAASCVLAFSGVARADHPSTLFDAARLAKLQAARTTTHVELAAALKAVMDAQNGQVVTTTQFSDARLLGNVVAGDAIAAMVLNVASYQTLAKQNLLAMLGWSDWGFGDGDDLTRGHLIIGAAIAYDVLYPLLSDTERSSVRTRLASEAARFQTAVSNHVWWSSDWLQNHNWINFGALGLAGFALEGEDSHASGWVAAARANSTTVGSVLDLIDDGSWHEGVGYQQYGWSMAMPYWIASERRGIDVSSHEMLRSYGTYRLYTQLPDLAQGYVMTHGDWSGWAGPGTTQVLRYAAAKFRDGDAQEAARRWIAGTRRSTHAEDTFYLALEYVAYDPTVAASDTTAISPDFYGDDQQVAILRSGWLNGSLVLGFKSGVLGGRGNWNRLRTGGAPGGSLNISHDHMDDLGLWMYADGQWLLPECVGYNIGRTSGPKAWMTEFHNALLFDGAGQLGDDKGSNDNGPSFPWFFQREAHLTTVASTADYAFARGDGTHLYPSTANVQSLLRTVSLSRDGWVVLRDDVRLGAPHAVDQVFHVLDAASQSGAWIRGNAKDDRVLGVRVVSPANFTATFTAQTADKLTKQFESDGSVTQVKVRPSTASTATSFLELLWPTRGVAWAQRPDVQPLDSSKPESGFSVALSAATESWIYANSSGISAGRFTVQGDVAVVREALDGTLQRVALLGSGRVEEGSKLLLTSTGAGVLEVRFSSGTAQLSGTDPGEVSFDGTGVNAVTFNGSPVPWYRDGALVRLGVAPTPPPAPVPAPAPPPPEPVDAGTPVDVTPPPPPIETAPDAGLPADAPPIETTPDAGLSSETPPAESTPDAGTPVEPPPVEASVDAGVPPLEGPADSIPPLDVVPDTRPALGTVVAAHPQPGAPDASEAVVQDTETPLNQEVPHPRGCGCDGAGAALAWAGLTVLLRRRR